MPDAGTGGAAAAGGATTSGDGSESSRHRHRAQQGDSERPEPGSAPQQSSSGVLKLFGKRLLQAGRHILSHKSWMKTVPTENCDVLMTFALLRGAEEMGLRKGVKPEFGGGARSFSCEEDYIYENIESELCFFTSQERQTIIKYWMDNLRAKQGEVLHNIIFLEGQPIPELRARGVIQQIFPLHEQRILNQLMKSWVQAVCEKQPLDICDYFGVKIAMYFAWLGFYTTSMLYPAVIGFVLWMLTESDQSQTSRDICCVVFALFNVVWATLFLERWKRRGAELAYKWGTLDTPSKSLEEPRPQFRGVKRCSPITGCEEFYYPPWRRRVFRWLVSLPICILCLCFVFLVMLICFELQEFVMGIKEMPRLARFIPKIMLAITVSACDEVYRKIACWLNDMNYRLQSAYEKNLIIKMVLFQFVNSYLSLFYIGFYLKDMERLKEKCLNGGCGVPDEEEGGERDEADSGRFSEGETEEENVIDCGLKLRKVSFIEKVQSGASDELLFVRVKITTAAVLKVDRRPACGGAPMENSFLEEGSPTMVEKGMDPASVFEMCDDDDDNGIHDVKDPGGGSAEGLSAAAAATAGSTAPLPSASDGAASLRHRRRGQSVERTEPKTKRESWMDPPEERESTTLTQAEMESCMQTYADTFQDYQEMFVQFGYVVLFSSAFPLAAMCALINNIIEIRSDAFKLCTGLQRPFGLRVESIGQWQTAMEAMGLIAIIVNCYLIGQCGQLQRLFPWLSPEMAIISIVILEHFAILLKYVIHVAIPDIPTWVKEEMAKLDYQRREAFKQKHERQAQQHYQQLQRRKREEEERQRQAEHMARRERERDDSKGDSSGDHHHDKNHGSKSRSGGGGGGGPSGSDKPKRPSSLLANNNVMKLKQIIPLQSKFSSSGARSPQSPTGSEPKLPGFLSFKFLKSPENKKEGAAAAASAAASTNTAAASSSSSSSSSSGSSSQERSQSPSKAFNPGKLFNFGKSEGGACVNGAPPPRPGDGSSSERQTSRSDLNGVPDEIPSPPGEGSENGHAADLDPASSKI
uniref:Anoctamin n=1 Tax=Poecilia mexicana TaxID=48701 RepID=A0A3B3XDK8_9TELE